MAERIEHAVPFPIGSRCRYEYALSIATGAFGEEEGSVEVNSLMQINGINDFFLGSTALQASSFMYMLNATTASTLWRIGSGENIITGGVSRTGHNDIVLTAGWGL
jgi:hypothetical protein